MATVPGIAAGQLIKLPSVGRKLRTPRHIWQTRQRPFQMQPFLVAPVLPGETMKNAFIQYSALTDPIKNPLLGWWLEHWLVYVPFRAMPDSQHLQDMVLDPAFGELNAAADEAASTKFYHYHAADPSYVMQALQAFIEAELRNEGETWLTGHLDNVPQIGIVDAGPFESMVLDATATEPDTLPGMGDDDGNLDVIHGSGGATNFSGAYDAYQALVAAKVLDITFEDWLKTYGVRMPKPNDEPVPEVLRYWKDWKLPGQTVDASDGSIAAAVKWRDDYRADKDRRFKEPGVILGVQCFTPKIFFKNQKQVTVDSLKRSLDWLPAVLAEHAYTSLKKFTSDGSTTGDGPLGFTPSGDHFIDIRDLFVNGDQFVNFALTETDANLFSLPAADLTTRWVTSADVDALFANAAPLNQVRTEGICRFGILGNIQDMTP